MDHYLVTGATGAVGSAIVPKILRATGAEVTALVRAGDRQHLRARRTELITALELGDDDASRLHAVAGDVAWPRLGLPDAAYERLVPGVTHIVHAAGDVHMGRPLAQARALAVGSARHVVQLARALAARGGLEKVEVLSTVGVGGRAPWPVPERWLDEPRSFHNSYERSKAEAEAYLREQRDIPLTVHRPSMVVGDSESGRAIRFQIFHAICDFLSGQQTLGLVPRTGSVRLDTVPNDYVADAVLWSSRSTETTGRVLHLCSGPSTSVRLDELGAQVRGLLGSLGASVPRPVPVAPAVYRRAAWLGRHVAPRALRGRARFIELLLEYLADERGFENGQTRRMLETADISLPAPRSYLPAVLARYYCSAS